MRMYKETKTNVCVFLCDCEKINTLHYNGVAVITNLAKQ